MAKNNRKDKKLSAKKKKKIIFQIIFFQPIDEAKRHNPAHVMHSESGSAHGTAGEIVSRGRACRGDTHLGFRFPDESLSLVELVFFNC